MIEVKVVVAVEGKDEGMEAHFKWEKSFQPTVEDFFGCLPYIQKILFGLEERFGPLTNLVATFEAMREKGSPGTLETE